MSLYGYNDFTDTITVLVPEDDVATVNWGGKWRMPTNAELTELCEKCTWIWIALNGVDGYKVVGPNGNFIFLPAAGYVLGSTLSYIGSGGYYRSSSLYADVTFGSFNVYFDSDRVDWGRFGNRCHGHSVRPVCP